MRIATQAEQFGLPERHANVQPDPDVIADLLRGPRITAGLNRFAAPRLDEIPDSAYGGVHPNAAEPEFDPGDGDYEGWTQTEFNRMRRDWDNSAQERAEQAAEAYDNQLDEDELSGYNWGPPPDPNMIPEHLVGR